MRGDNPRRILVLTSDAIRENMAGPAIRAWNIARVLATFADVRLISSAPSSLDGEGFSVHWVAPGRSSLSTHEQWADVIIVQGLGFAQYPRLARSTKVIVLDAYNVMPLEHLAVNTRTFLVDAGIRIEHARRVHNHALALSDMVVVSSSRQRDLYLGSLLSLGRLNPATSGQDPSFHALVRVAPFGAETAPSSEHAPSILRDVLAPVTAGDKVLVWGGGLYEWFDPESLMRAVGNLSKKRPNLRLVFMGSARPGQDGVSAHVSRLVDLARDIDPLGEHIVFNQTWVPYAHRISFLAEADAGVSVHRATAETYFSYRTRMLDYLAAGLPIVCSEGDTFAEIVARERLGIVVPVGGAAELEAAIERVLYDESFARECRTNVERLRASFDWEISLASLVDFVRNPQPAADRPRRRRFPAAVPAPKVPSLASRILTVVDHEGITGLVRRAGLRRASTSSLSSSHDKES